MFVKGTFSPGLKIVHYHTKPVPIIAVKDLRKGRKNTGRARDVLMREENAQRLERVAEQAKVSAKSKGIDFIATDGKGPVQIESLLQ